MYIVFVSQKIEAYNHTPILPLTCPRMALLTSELQNVGIHNINAFLHKMLNLGFQKFRLIFLRVFFLVATLFWTYGYLFELILYY